MSADLTPAVVGAIAVITAAFIGLIVAVTSAVIAKEQKISEFRQAWIDALRNDIAELTALAFSAATERSKIFTLEESKIELPKLKNETYTKIIELVGLVTKTSTLIRLRLNTKSEHQEFISEINTLLHLLKSIDFSGQQDFQQIDKIQKVAHHILKNEWEVVKKGEKHFVRFRDFGELCLFAFITAFFVLLAAVKFPEYFPSMFN
ncbi:hypothetical protein ORI98_06250 [Shewanella sp. ULN5]|uniref:hypothetical protein n=1 Tax=Shewanella sp. ULN5 TaxID=2994678 RepID=UPI00273DED0E|nr:hypothetical protein [Shewanella sp. ULN5]MDP5146036.1 hypothetical protein [Shewanella sp. ULN5]